MLISSTPWPINGGERFHVYTQNILLTFTYYACAVAVISVPLAVTLWIEFIRYNKHFSSLIIVFKSVQ